MDLAKQYIVQAVINAANNLRLSTEKIEVVALIRETISNSEDPEREIQEMKKITEFSTFAIKLGEVYGYIAKSKVDFLKVSDKFKEHSYFLVKDLNNLLDRVTPQTYRELLNKLHSASINIDLTKENHAAEVQSETEKEPVPDVGQQIKPEEALSETLQQLDNDKLKEEIILEEEETVDTFLFENYEEKILKPIRELDALLKNLTPDTLDPEVIKKHLIIMRRNAELSSKNGFDIIAEMHQIFAHSLHLIQAGSLVPEKEVIEGMRACLIVIVAVIRAKEVDITNYLNRAEYFGRQIQNLQ